MSFCHPDYLQQLMAITKKWIISKENLMFSGSMVKQPLGQWLPLHFQLNIKNQQFTKKKVQKNRYETKQTNSFNFHIFGPHTFSRLCIFLSSSTGFCLQSIKLENTLRLSVQFSQVARTWKDEAFSMRGLVLSITVFLTVRVFLECHFGPLTQKSCDRSVL